MKRPGPDMGCRAIEEEEEEYDDSEEEDLMLRLGVASDRIHFRLKRQCAFAMLYDRCCTKFNSAVTGFFTLQYQKCVFLYPK